MGVTLLEIEVPDFGLPVEMPRIPPATYAARCNEAWRRAGCDWLVIYGDREHIGNIALLSGYDPRFEEAMLLLGPAGKRVLVVGNEGEAYAPLAGLPNLDVALAQSVSLMGQDRSLKPSLATVLREAGVARGQTIGLVGWKYFEPAEQEDDAPAFFAPHALVVQLARLAGGMEALREATPVLMHPVSGLRSIIDADQIALHEWGAARASAAVWRIIDRIRDRMSETDAASAMGYAGEPMSAHMMLASADSSAEIVGLRSPGARVLVKGDGVTAAVGYWGGLSARAGLLDTHDETFLKLAADYFEGLVAWYAAADIGVTGGALYDATAEALARSGLRSALNPGHLTGHDEWTHTPVRPGSTERIASGMPFQVDVIPTPMQKGWTLNCEDGIVFADAELRASLSAKHPEVFARIEARRAFVRDRLGIALKDCILPLSSTPLCLPPFWLNADQLLALE